MTVRCVCWVYSQRVACSPLTLVLMRFTHWQLCPLVTKDHTQHHRRPSRFLFHTTMTLNVSYLPWNMFSLQLVLVHVCSICDVTVTWCCCFVHDFVQLLLALFITHFLLFRSVFWHCRFSSRKSIWPVNITMSQYRELKEEEVYRLLGQPGWPGENDQ